MPSARSSRSNSQVTGASTRLGSLSSQSSSSSSSAASSNSFTSEALSRTSSIVSVGSQVIEGLLRDQVRYADKPDGPATGRWGNRRNSWDSFTSHNSVDVTPNRLKARHRTQETYLRKPKLELQASLQALAPQDKLASQILHLRHTPKSSGKAVDDLRYTSGDKATFSRTLTQRNRTVDNDGVVAGKLQLLPGTKDKYRVMSTRHTKNHYRLGDASLYESIENPKRFVRKVSKAVPGILQTDLAGLNGKGIDGLPAGLTSKSHSANWKANATTHNAVSRVVYDTPDFKLDTTETYDLTEEDRLYGLKDANVRQCWTRESKSGNGQYGEDYEETLENTGSKLIRTTEHAAGCNGMQAGAILIGQMRAAHGANGSKKSKKKTSAARRKNKVADPTQT